MKFLNKFIKTNIDFKSHTSLVVHTLEGCNLKCYKCHNYDELVLNKPNIFYDEFDLEKELIRNGFLFDAIILSGGEFLISPPEELIKTLNIIRKNFKGKIVLNTNGTFPNKLKKIINLNLIDVIFMDIKFNLWEKNLHEGHKKIIGINNIYIMKNKMLESFNILINSDLERYFRSVRYPFVPDEEFDNIKDILINKGEKYKINKFINI